jgi:hypothetical protein
MNSDFSNPNTYMLQTPSFLFVLFFKESTGGAKERHAIVRDMIVDFQVVLARYARLADVRGVFQYLCVIGDYDKWIDGLISVENTVY